MTDSIQPTLNNLTFPNSVDIGSGSSVLTFTAMATDDIGGSGVQRISISFDNGLNIAGHGSTISFGGDTSQPDNFMDSTPNTASISIPLTSASATTGVYNISTVDLYDNANNHFSYFTTQLQGMGINTSLSIVNNTTATAPINHAPTIPATSVNLPNGTENTPYQIYKTGLLAGFNDIDNDPLSVENLTATNGSLVPNGDSWTFTPNMNYSGVVNLNYSVSDGKGGYVAAPAVNFNLNKMIATTNNPPTGNVIVEGFAKAGVTLSVNATSLYDADGINFSTMNYQWFVDTSPVANGNNYTVAAADTGKTITVKANYTDNLGHNESVMSGNVIVQAASTYNLSVDKNNVNEGETVNLTVQSSTGFAPPNEVVNLIFGGTASNTDLNGGYIPTSVNIGADGKGQISLSFLKDNVPEGTGTGGGENLTFSLANDPSKSVTININDAVNPPTYNFWVDKPNVNEGDTATLNLQTTNVPANTAVNFSFAGSATLNDVVGNVLPNTFFVDTTGMAKLPIIFMKDTLVEGMENLIFTLTNDPTKLVTLNINDVNPPTYNFGIDRPNVNEGETVNLSLQTTNVLAGTAVNLNFKGSATPADLANGSIPNAFFVNADGKTNIPLTFLNDKQIEGSENLILWLANDPTKTVTININDPKNNLPTGGVNINGDAKVGKTLLAQPNNIQDVDGLGVFNYQWMSNGAIVSGKTGESYTLINEDVNKNISVQISYTDGLGNVEKLISSPILVQSASTSSMKLSVDRVDVNEGESVYFKVATTNVPLESNINFPLTFSGSISGADVEKDMLLPKSVWVGKDGIGTIAVSFLNDNLPEGKENLIATLINDPSQSVMVNVSDYVGGKTNTPPKGDVVIKGEMKVGQTLFVQNNITDADGMTGKFEYQWQAGGIFLANGDSVTLTRNEVGKTLQVTAKYIDNGGTTEKVTSLESAKVIDSGSSLPPVGINNLPTGEVTILGDSIVGQKLTVQNTLKDADGLGVIAYQWLKNGLPISGATKENYTLTKADLGKAISVMASYTDKLKNAESMTSDETDLIGLAEPTYSLSADKSELDEGATVTFKLETTNLSKGGLVDFNFAGEIADDDITGGFPDAHFVLDANGKASLSLALAEDELTEGDEALTLTLADAMEQSVSITVNDTSIAEIVNHEPTGSVTVKGTTKVGNVLSVTNTLKDEDGLGAFKYQWLSDGKAIKNATKDTYKLVKTDIGKKISLKVSYTDDLDNAEVQISSETSAIKASIAINGVTKKGDAGKNKLLGADKNDDLSGLANADTLIGNAGDDLLDGGVGNDSIDGGNGNDELIGGDGNDKLIAGSGHDLLDGGKGDDKLQGDAGKDTLNGGAGADTMEGGDGDDYYVVDNRKDTVTDSTSKLGGSDTIETTLTAYTLGKSVENLILAGIVDSSGVGNELNNQITGNVGDNSLKGEAGNDKLIGGDGADTLDGGKGMDTLTGGNDDDTYYMNNDNDKIVETESGGEQDQVISTVDFELSTSPNVEVLTLSGVKAIRGTGDENNNVLQEKEGGTIANVFNGDAGDDTVNGEGGNDTIEGGEGNDVIDGGDGIDVAIFTATQNEYLIIRNPDTVGIDQIQIEYLGEDDSINEGSDTLSNIEILQFADGDTLNTSEVTDSSPMVILTGVENLA